MAAPILPFTPTKSVIEKPKEPTFPPRYKCISGWPIGGCLFMLNPGESITLPKTRKCPHCGASERLTTGECAYCRQY